MTKIKVPLEVGLASLMLVGVLFNAALAKPAAEDPDSIASASRALSPGTTQPSNLTHQPLPQVPGVTIAPPLIPASELTSPDLPQGPRQRRERMK
jgi:hypothetical protein